LNNSGEHNVERYRDIIKRYSVAEKLLDLPQTDEQRQNRSDDIVIGDRRLVRVRRARQHE